MHSFLHLKSASRVGILCPTPLPGMDTCRIHTVPVHAQVQVLYTVYSTKQQRCSTTVQHEDQVGRYSKLWTDPRR